MTINFQALEHAILEGYKDVSTPFDSPLDPNHNMVHFTESEKAYLAAALQEEYKPLQIDQKYFDAISRKTLSDQPLTKMETTIYSLTKDETPGEFSEKDLFNREDSPLTEEEKSFLLGLGDKPQRAFIEHTLVTFKNSSITSAQQDIQIGLSGLQLPWFAEGCHTPTITGSIATLFPNGKTDYQNILHIDTLETQTRGQDVGGPLQPAAMGHALVYLKDGTVLEAEFVGYGNDSDYDVEKEYYDFLLAVAGTQYYHRKAFYSDMKRSTLNTDYNNGENNHLLLSILLFTGVTETIAATAWYNREFRMPKDFRTNPPGGIKVTPEMIKAQDVVRKDWKPPTRVRTGISRALGLGSLVFAAAMIYRDFFAKPDQTIANQFFSLFDDVSYEEYEIILDNNPELEELAIILNFQYGRYHDHLLEQKRAESNI